MNDIIFRMLSSKEIRKDSRIAGDPQEPIEQTLLPWND